MNRRRREAGALFAPVDGASLAYFRIVFYAVMLWQSHRYLVEHWVQAHFAGREFNFKYLPFFWVSPWPGNGLEIHLRVMQALAVLGMLGLYYRPAAFLFALSITYTFLLEQALYLNHMYLVCLLSFLMVLVPADRTWSVDAWRRRLPSASIPAWGLWLLRFQLAVPYCFGGLAKINGDWLRGEPIRAWIAANFDFPFFGRYFHDESTVYVMAYGSLFLDLLGPFGLLYRRTRVFVYFLYLSFHFANARLFHIGIFPWIMIVGTAIFFPPDWPRRLLGDFRRLSTRSLVFLAGGIVGFLIGGLLPHEFWWPRAVLGALGTAIAFYHLDEPFRAGTPHMPAPSYTVIPRDRRLLLVMGLWAAVQILVPLRHFVIPGDVHWTEEGHNFSWHMKLRDKEARGDFRVTDPATQETWTFEPGSILTRQQTSKMLRRPHMTVEFARWLEERYRRKENRADVEIRANIHASLNGREEERLIDPDVDLTRVPYPWFGHASWIRPLTKPLRRNWRPADDPEGES